jgi:excisionase family DNA binding protein
MTMAEQDTRKPFMPSTLAVRWGCSTTMIYDLLNAGDLAGFRLGKLWRIPAGAVEEYECRTTASGCSSEPEPTQASAGTTASSDSRRHEANTAARLARLTT